jgi:ferrous iron transport protein A
VENCAVKEYNEIPLSDLELFKPATISSIDTKDKNILKKLMAFGILPGVNIKMIRKFPSYIFEIGNTRIATDDKIAKSIRVIAN